MSKKEYSKNQDAERSPYAGSVKYAFGRFVPVEIRQDDSGHTFYIPSEMNDVFDRWAQSDFDDDEFDPNFFDKYRVEGDAPQLYVADLITDSTPL